MPTTMWSKPTSAYSSWRVPTRCNRCSLHTATLSIPSERVPELALLGLSHAQTTISPRSGRDAAWGCQPVRAHASPPAPAPLVAACRRDTSSRVQRGCTRAGTTMRFTPATTKRSKGVPAAARSLTHDGAQGGTLTGAAACTGANQTWTRSATIRSSSSSSSALIGTGRSAPSSATTSR